MSLGAGWLVQNLFHAVILLFCLNLCGALTAGAASREEQMAAVKKEKAEAFFQAQDIVNQPVRSLKRTPDMVVMRFADWGKYDVVTPDFDYVDMRATQQKLFDGYQYVACDLNPGVVFVGNELEFNERTKYFYNDFRVPKKKLTEAEMLEVNRLCRIIGRCNRELAELQNPEPPLTKIYRVVAGNKLAAIMFTVVLFLALRLVRRRQAQKTEA
jgi:hypothetical protein